MALSWSGRRQLLYYGVALVILCIVAYAVWASFFNTPPTCTDGKQNGTELGVDCGGSCALVCPDEARDPTAMWSRAFQSGEGVYTVAAYIRNNNLSAGAKSAHYAFYLFDADNSLVKEQDGTVDLPPIPVIPIIAPNIPVGNRVVTSVKFAFAERPQWVSVPAKSLPTLFISQQRLQPDGSRLSATISNPSLLDAKNVTATAVLFDSAGVARAASKSLIATVPGHGLQNVDFTWPGGNADIVRAEITLLPSF